MAKAPKAAPAAATPTVAPATEATATAVTFTVGQEPTFKAYQELTDDQPPIFEPGEKCRITAIDETTGCITIASLDAKKSDNVYSDELNAVKPAKAAPKAKAAVAPAAPAAPKMAAPAKPAKAAKAPNLAAAAAKPAKAAKAPKPVAVPKPKEEPVAISIVNTEEVEKLMAGDALTAARNLIDQSEETFFTLGGVLAHIYHGEMYKALGGEFEGKQGWQIYIEKELGVGYRKGMHLIDIYQSFTALEIDQTRLTAVGWSKAKELTRALTAENAQELLDYATEHTKEEVIDYVKTTYPTATSGTGSAQPQERVKKVTYKFSATDTEAEVINQALEIAKTKGETTDLSAAYYLIVSEWAQLIGGVETTLEEDMERVGAKHGVELGIVEDEPAPEVVPA